MGTRSCGGVGDSVERGGGRGAAENIAPLSGGPLLTLERELVSVESGFPRRPRLVGAGEAAPVGALLGEAACGEEQAGGYGCDSIVVDWERRSHRLSLCIF